MALLIETKNGDHFYRSNYPPKPLLRTKCVFSQNHLTSWGPFYSWKLVLKAFLQIFNVKEIQIFAVLFLKCRKWANQLWLPFEWVKGAEERLNWITCLSRQCGPPCCFETSLWKTIVSSVCISWSFRLRVLEIRLAYVSVMEGFLWHLDKYYFYIGTGGLAWTVL